MPETYEIAIRRKRASAPKVRTGCITCKIRHVKCDEQKPFCHRCLSTGRKCDGYTSQQTPRNHAQQTALVGEVSERSLVLCAEKSLTTINVGKLEHHALDYFYNRAGPLLCLYFDEPFWNRLVLQLSHSEPAVRHAIITISAAYEQVEKHHPKPFYVEASTRFSLHHYNKAMSHLINYLSSNKQAAEIPLIACLLFICLEHIQGDVDRALTHLSSGINIIQSWKKKGIHKSTPISKEMIHTSESVEQYLMRTFSWLGTITSAFHSPTEITQSEEDDFMQDPNIFPCSPPQFTSVYDARDALYNPMNLSLQFGRSVLLRKYNFEITPEDEAEHARIKTLLDNWQFSFQTLILRDYSIDIKEREALKFARIHFEVIWIWIRTALEAEECAFDRYIAEFARVVDLCEPLVACAPPFSFGVGYIAPLYHVACKCRDRIVRRRALALLYQAFPRREVLFTAERAYKLAVRTIDLEESGMDPGSSTALPPECSRIHYADTSHGDSAWSGPGNLVRVTFFSKPDGLRGAWKLQTEYMDLSSGVIDPFEDYIMCPLPII